MRACRLLFSQIPEVKLPNFGVPFWAWPDGADVVRNLKMVFNCSFIEVFCSAESSGQTDSSVTPSTWDMKK